MKISTYVRAHWFGELPPSLTYGINFILITIVYRFLFGFAYNQFGIDSIGAKFLISYLFTLGAVLLIWGSVGAFRSLNKMDGGMKGITGLFYFLFLIGTVRFYLGIFK